MKIKDKNIIEDVKKFVKEECKRNDKGFYESWISHLSSVASNATELAKKLDADKEVVEISAWLHDIGTILKRKEDHHITGAKIAEEKLKELGYPDEKIRMVKHCIFSHRASQKIPRETIEAQILADADAMSHFSDPALLEKAEQILGDAKNNEEIKERIKAKLNRSWNKLSDPGKRLIQEKNLKSLERMRTK